MSLLLLFRPRGVAPAGPANYDATGALAAQEATLSGSATLGRTSTGALAADAATISGVATNDNAPVVVATARPAVGGRRRYVVIDDPDELCEELKKEEKLVAKDRKKLKILEKKKPSSVVGIYRVEQQIHALEIRLDDRLARVAELVLMIQAGLDAIDDDDEEVMLLS